MSELAPLTDAEVDELKALQKKCLKQNGDFKSGVSQKNQTRLCELEARIPDDDAAIGCPINRLPLFLLPHK